MLRKTLIFVLLFVTGVILIGMRSRSQSNEIAWSAPVNISNSPSKVSTDPYLLADPAGYVHLFWSEKVTDEPGEAPDTIIYSKWDGGQWSHPVDIFLAPLSDGNPVASYPHGVIDDKGIIHLIWLQEPNAPNYSIYYSAAPANKAGLAQAWKRPLVLADDLTGSKYSAHIAYSPPSTLHIVYARIPMGDSIKELRAVSYIRSTDGGETWSEPVDVFTVPSADTGASDTRLLVGESNQLYLTWTLWDNTGNGQAIYFTRSLDGGLNWAVPIILAKRQEGEYERDWANLVNLGSNRIAVLWEGGWRAYRYAMYSSDSGASWSEPIDTFPWLIGDNGYIEFARDSNGVQHLFLAQRVREGNLERGDYFGLWHSVYEGGTRWSEPVLVALDETSVKSMTNPKAAITNGNQVVAAWYGSGIYEIYVVTGEILSAPPLTPTPWPPVTDLEVTSQPTATNPAESTSLTQTAIPTDQSSGIPEINKEPETLPEPSNVLLQGILPALLFIVLFLVLRNFRRRME